MKQKKNKYVNEKFLLNLFTIVNNIAVKIKKSKTNEMITPKACSIL